MKSIAVFFGGVSSEHDISVITGVFTVNSLNKELFNSIPIYIHNDGKWYTGEALREVSFYKSINLKRLNEVVLLPSSNELFLLKGKKLKKLYPLFGAINALHGKNGEDGAITGLLQLSKIPVASPDIFCSALSIDKERTKIVVEGLNVECVSSVCISRKEYYRDETNLLSKIENNLNFPIIVKPNTCGSSIGIGKAENLLELKKVLNCAFEYDDKVVCERYLTNFSDINCAVARVGDKILVSECERPKTFNEILTFADKYQNTKVGLEREFPAKLPQSISSEIKAKARLIYEKLGFDGIVRFDFLFADSKVYFNEINAVPGSLAYYLFCEKISEFTDLLTDLLNNSFAKFISKSSLKSTFQSSVLSEDFSSIKK